MKALVAGVGNIFFGDDGFGIEVVRRLPERKLPEGVSVMDFGLRGFDLACCIAEPWDVVIFVDATRRGDEPGSVYVIELDPGKQNQTFASAVEPHGLNLVRAIELAKTMGGVSARLLLVGCEPANCAEDEGFLGLSAPVESAIEVAMDTIERILSELQVRQHGLESESGARA